MKENSMVQKENMSRFKLCLLCCVILIAPLFGQALDSNNSILGHNMPQASTITISERSDFSRYENGKYTGLTYRESFLNLFVTNEANYSTYDGSVYIFENTVKNQQYAAKRIQESNDVNFKVLENGLSFFSKDPGYPLIRGIPSFPKETIPVGAYWTSEAIIVVRPDPQNKATRINTYVEYWYEGIQSYAGEAALYIKARYATRYKGNDPDGDPALQRSEGGRTADIYVSPKDLSTLFIRESVDDTFWYENKTIRLKGFILHFYKGSVPEQRVALLEQLGAGGTKPTAGGAGGTELVGSAGSGAGGTKPTAGGAGGTELVGSAGSGAGGANSAGGAVGAKPAAGGAGGTKPTAGGAGGTELVGSAGSGAGGAGGAGGANPSIALVPSTGKPAYEIEESTQGVVLLLHDLRFVADSAELLPGEKERLDLISKALIKIESAMFLVEGHAADVGKAQGQYTLSEQRAKKIVDELTKRGIPEKQFIYRGLGGDKPIASNNTEEGRAKNRRVEITIMN